MQQHLKKNYSHSKFHKNLTALLCVAMANTVKQYFLNHMIFTTIILLLQVTFFVFKTFLLQVNITQNIKSLDVESKQALKQ